MLYNPQWKRETVGDLIAWLETKPPEERYNFGIMAQSPEAVICSN